MGKYRGLNITGGLNANFRKIKVRKTVDTESLEDRGTIAEAASDLPTKGAGHRRGRGALKSQRKAAQGATRGSISMGWIVGDDSNVIGTHDYGYIFQNTLANDQAAWETRRALGVAASIADEENAVATAPVYATGVSLYNSTGIIPAGTPLILNEDGTVSAVAGSAGGLDIPGMSTTPTITILNENSYGTVNSDGFGAAMDMNSTHMAVGAPWEESSSGDNNSGVVYIYDISDGSLVTTIQNPNIHGSAANDSFGAGEIRMSESYLAVIAEYETYYANSSNPDLTGGSRVYVFDTTNWQLQYTLSNHLPDGDYEDDFFGFAIDITDTHVIAGAKRVNESSDVKQSGKAYVYDVTDGTLLYTFDNPNPMGTAQSDYFGSRTRLSSTHAFVQSHEDGDNLGFSGQYYDGKVFVFDLSNGSLVHTIDNPDPDGTGHDQFGDCMTINPSETKIAISSWKEASDSGKIYVYDLSTYTLLYTIDNPNSQGTSAGDYFGMWIDMNDTHLVAGARYNEGSGGELGAGSFYVFNISDGSLEKTLDYPGTPPANYEAFGDKVAINNTHIATSSSSINDTTAAADSGAAYLYQVGAPETTNLTDSNFIGFAKDGFSGASLGKVVSGGGVVSGFTGLIAGNDYYVQPDGSISEVSTAPAVLAGTALSDTTLQVAAMSPSYSYTSANAVSGTVATSLTNTFSGAAAITLDGNTVAIGYGVTNTANEYNGKVVIHTKQNGVWVETQVINCPTNTSNWNLYHAGFGDTIKFTDDGTRMLVDAPGYGTWENNYGGFFIFDKNETTGLFEETQRIFNQQDFYISNERGSKMDRNRVDMSSDGSLIALQQMGTTGHYNSESKKSYILIYRKTEDGTYSYVNNHLITDQSYYEGTHRRNIALSDNGHIVLGDDDSGTANVGTHGGAEHVYYDIENNTFVSQILYPTLDVPHSGYNGLRDYGEDVAITQDGEIIGVYDAGFAHQAVEDGSQQSTAIFVFKHNGDNTYSQVQRIEHPNGLGEQTQSLQFNRDGSQLYAVSSSKLTIFNWDNETNTYVEDSTTDGYSTYRNRFWMSRDGAHMLMVNGTTFTTYGGTT